MASHSQLKYGARLINSYLGDNATISCCEVLNSLIFPAHEQHHNNSFLTASTVMGQSNIAAGATIGSNHNSRSPDGELVAGRGFWPGLCVSLKHNSKFAIYTIIAKGDYPAELNIPIPFSLVSNDVPNDQLVIMPAYWFMYNMYAIARNSWKYVDRDKRTDRKQLLEYDYLAPDSVNEIFTAFKFLKRFTGKAYLKKEGSTEVFTDEQVILAGYELLEKDDPLIDKLEITGDCFENSKRRVVLLKVRQGYHVFKQLITLYAANQILSFINANKTTSYDELLKTLPSKFARNEWMNVGGQLIPKEEVAGLKKKVISDKITSWDDLHEFYSQQAELYPWQKLKHALGCLTELHGHGLKKGGKSYLINLLNEAVATKEWMNKNIYESREKDYTNPFRQMTYESMEEMNEVVGPFEENSFIQHQQLELKQYKKMVAKVKKQLVATGVEEKVLS
jgi:hypothetical protein